MCAKIKGTEIYLLRYIYISMNIYVYLPEMQVSPSLQAASELHLRISSPVHFFDGSPLDPDGHLQEKDPTTFSQMAFSPQGLPWHSSISMQDFLLADSWKPGTQRQKGAPFWTKH